MKKFKSRLRDVRALWEKGVWQFEEKVADKQERIGMEDSFENLWVIRDNVSKLDIRG